MSPRVSLPSDPASRRKQGVYATYDRGRVPGGRISSRCRFVTGTSAVGIMYSPSSLVLKDPSANLGSCPVPVMAAAFTRIGGENPVYPASLLWGAHLDMLW